MAQFFTDWLKDTNQLEDLYLGEKTITKNDFKKNKNYIKELEATFGKLMPITNMNGADGFFNKAVQTVDKPEDIISDIKLCVVRNSKAYQNLMKVGKAKTLANKDYEFTFSDGNVINIHVSDLKQSATDGTSTKIYVGKGDAATEIQEAITALLLTMKVRGTALDTIKEDVPPLIKHGKQVADNRSDLYKWLLASDPIKETGVCKYIEFGVPKNDVQSFKIQFEEFLKSWIYSFEAIWRADIKGLINSVFKKGIANWGQAQFGHYRLSKNCPKVTKSIIPVLEEYLGKKRLSFNKDNIDKSDIVLYFDAPRAEKIMTTVMHAKDLDEHNQLLNYAFINQELMGISLKQVVSEATIAAANFDKAATTAVGPTINEKKQIFIEYHGRTKADMKKNTFAEVSQDDVIETEGKSSGIILKLANKDHIHCESSEINLDIRTKGGSSIASEFREKGHPAFGNANIPMAKSEIKGEEGPNINIPNLVKQIMDDGSAENIGELVTAVAQVVAQKFIDKPQTLAMLFAEAAGYPVKIVKKSGTEIKILAAPYLKLY